MAPQRVGDLTMEELKAIIEEKALTAVRQGAASRELHGLYPIDRVYNESEDPVLEGLFSGPVDMAERAEDILDEMVKPRRPDPKK